MGTVCVSEGRGAGMRMQMHGGGNGGAAKGGPLGAVARGTVRQDACDYNVLLHHPFIHLACDELEILSYAVRFALGRGAARSAHVRITVAVCVRQRVLGLQCLKKRVVRGARQVALRYTARFLVALGLGGTGYSAGLRRRGLQQLWKIDWAQRSNHQTIRVSMQNMELWALPP